MLKIELTPKELTWILSAFFVLLSWPARILSGYAVSIAEQRRKPRGFIGRWTARLAAVPIVALYLLVLFLAQFTSWQGARTVFEQHAFLVPVPFFGL